MSERASYGAQERHPSLTIRTQRRTLKVEIGDAPFNIHKAHRSAPIMSILIKIVGYNECPKPAQKALSAGLNQPRLGSRTWTAQLRLHRCTSLSLVLILRPRPRSPDEKKHRPPPILHNDSLAETQNDCKAAAPRQVVR